MQMIEFCKSQPEKIVIIADAVDRVQRSFKESVMLDDLIRQEKIELHFYRENMVIGKNSSSSDIMRWDFSVMGAKSYVLQLSENVRRSIDYKIKNGEYCLRKCHDLCLDMRNAQIVCLLSLKQLSSPLSSDSEHYHLQCHVSKDSFLSIFLHG